MLLSPDTEIQLVSALTTSFSFIFHFFLTNTTIREEEHNADAPANNVTRTMSFGMLMICLAAFVIIKSPW